MITKESRFLTRESSFNRTQGFVGRADCERSRGLTLVELSVSMAIGLTVILMMGEVALSFSRSYSSVTKDLHGNMRAQVVLDRLVSEVVNGSRATLNPVNPVESDSIAFQQVVGVDGLGNAVYGNLIHIEKVPLEADGGNGLDDDGDGLIDESGIQIREDFAPTGSTAGPEDEVVIVESQLTGDGLKFTRQGAFVLIELSYQVFREFDSSTVTKTLRSGVRLRNP